MVSEEAHSVWTAKPGSGRAGPFRHRRGFHDGEHLARAGDRCAGGTRARRDGRVGRGRASRPGRRLRTVVLNAGQTGYFRSRYSREGLAAITAAFGALAPDDQLGVLNDRSALAYAGEEPMSALLELTKKFPADAEPVVASALVACCTASTISTRACRRRRRFAPTPAAS